MHIRVRDDDVLIPSRGWQDPFQRFKQVHEWILETDCIVHVPAILVENIKAFPECIEYVKEQTQSGRMLPEIHGLWHIDYGQLPKEEVKDHLVRCRDWIAETFGREPSIWYTPWGASQPHLHEAAAELDLTLVDVSRISRLEGEHGIIGRLKGGTPLEAFDGVEIFMHFWQGGARLLRFCRAVKHGSWEAAVEADPVLFRG